MRNVCLIPLLLCTLLARAGTLRTLDGRTVDGEIKLETSDTLSITPSRGGKPVPIELANVLSAVFKSAPAQGSTAVRTEDGRPPAPWKLIDIGALPEKAYLRYDQRGIYSVKSAGGDIGRQKDAFAFVQQKASGDAELVIKLLDMGSTPSRTVGAGLMFRADSDADAPFASIIYVGNDLRFFKRARRGENCDGGTVLPRAPLPLWLRMARHGNTFTSAVSQDGNNWDQLSSEAIDLPAEAIAGFVVCGREQQNTGAHAQALRFSTLSPLAITIAPANIPPGLLLRSGTLVANVQWEGIDETGLRINKNGQMRIPRTAVSRIVFSELTPELSTKIPEMGTGVLLREGDFVEGELRTLKDGRVELSSVLFGLKRFEPRQQALAVAINPLEPARTRLIVRTSDGSVYLTRQLALQKDKVTVDDPAAGPLTFNRGDIAEISAGADRMDALASLKPSGIECVAKDAGDGLISTEKWTRLLLGGIPVQSGMIMTAGTSVSWDLGGQYRLLTLTCGVPNSVLPTASVRFAILADGKELFRSPARTSVDAPLPVSVNMKDVKKLTLQTQSTLAQPLPTPGVFAEASLIK